MAIKLRSRKTQQIHSSLWISVPYEWVQHHKLSKGDVIDVELFEDGDALLIRPAKEGHDA